MSNIVATAVKAQIADADMMMSGEFPEALSAKVETTVGDAIKRAQANGRKTVRPEDL